MRPSEIFAYKKPDNVRFSNRPVGVKHFQTVHGYGVDVAHGLVLLFGIGTKALPLWDSRTMTMSNDAAATVRQPEIFHGGEERLGLHLDSLC